MSPKALVIGGDGLNCERETLRAFELVGCRGRIIHISELVKSPEILSDHQILAIPGGFSFGDEIHSGRVLKLKTQHFLSDALRAFVDSKKLVLGICNGFQVLIQLGILPFNNWKFEATLTHNQNGRFVNDWGEMKTNRYSKCIWTQDLNKECWLPVRHGEGRLVFQDENVLNEVRNQQLIPLYYQDNFNGSDLSAAGLNDPSGRVLGLMPHPEAAMAIELFPRRNDIAPRADGRKLFENAYQYFK